MKAFIVTGEQGRGKTTQAYNLIENFSKKDLYAYDVHGHYFEKYKSLSKIKGRPPMEIFLEIVSKVKNSVIVFEEATIFFSNKGRSDIIIELLVNNYHSKNIIIFLFHSLRSVPVEIMDFVQFIQMYHSNDRATLIKNKFKDDYDLLEVYNDVYEKTLNTDKNRDTGEYPNEYSKEYYHYSRVYSR